MREEEGRPTDATERSVKVRMLGTFREQFILHLGKDQRDLLVVQDRWVQRVIPPLPWEFNIDVVFITLMQELFGKGLFIYEVILILIVDAIDLRQVIYLAILLYHAHYLVFSLDVLLLAL